MFHFPSIRSIDLQLWALLLGFNKASSDENYTVVQVKNFLPPFHCFTFFPLNLRAFSQALTVEILFFQTLFEINGSFLKFYEWDASDSIWKIL